MRNLILFLRHAGCGFLARMLIAGGYARSARRRLDESGQITPIYFHNPPRALFERCVRWLAAEGYTFLSAAELIECLSGRRSAPRRAIWLSLDDGYREWLTNVVPVAQRYSVPVTLFVSPGIIEGDGLFPWLHDPDYPDPFPGVKITLGNGGREALTVDELRTVASYPEITIGGHTTNHVIMPLCPAETLRVEVAGCKEKLESWLGRTVETFAYPAGRNDEQSRECVAGAGFRLAATTEARHFDLGASCYAIPRLCVPDGVTFPEAVCNMLGIWRPFLDSIKKRLGMLSHDASKSPASRNPVAGDRGAAAGHTLRGPEQEVRSLTRNNSLSESA